MSWARSLVVAMSIAVCVCACGPSEGESISRRIYDAQSPLVVKVAYRPANLLDPEQVDVYVRSGTTEAEASDLWCRVVVPAAGKDMVIVALWNETGTQMMAVDAECH